MVKTVHRTSYLDAIGNTWFGLILCNYMGSSGYSHDTEVSMMTFEAS
jgi:hypothetical protein